MCSHVSYKTNPRFVFICDRNYLYIASSPGSGVMERLVGTINLDAGK